MADPLSKPCRKPKNANHNSNDSSSGSMQNSGKNACTRCGRRGHMADACQCTQNAKCFNCEKTGHFSKMCMSHSAHAQSRARPRVPIKSKHVVRHVSESTSGSEEDYENEYAYTTTHGETVTVTIANITTTMLIDSGSTCNIINTACKDMLVQQGVPLTACHRKIHPYSSPPIRVRQLVDANIMLDDGQSILSEFLIVEGDATPLLGKATAEKLGLLRVGVCHVTGSDEYRHKVVDRFPKLWTGIGCLKGVEVKLHIDKSVPPVAVRHNRVPFHQQQKVAKEIAKLEAADVIEKVSGPTEWVSRIVTPPKPKKPEEIRLCVDMRAANKAILQPRQLSAIEVIYIIIIIIILRTRHVTPTLDELITQFNGATIFSKVDLRSGYHQLVLHPSSRYITTFSTHVGLYQYKRLSFGINAAAEVFQHEIQTVIQGVAGAINISDDIAIFGVDQRAHDKALNEVLQKLQNAGLTANLEKCEFGKNKMEFFGLVFSNSVKRCIPCQANSTRRETKPLAISTLPRGPWLELSIDFCGPLPTGEYLLVIIDEFSRFPVVEVVRSTSAETVIPVVDNVFSLLGYPEIVKSDNGPPFNGHVWKAFMQENGIRHRKITPSGLKQMRRPRHSTSRS